jgi:23S rRNA pseudouridine955/2504/2580 synthase
VLFESDSALVVDKPEGLVTVPDRSGRETGVHGRLLALRPGQDLRIVHRLDRDTSGCLILAKGLAAARHFDAQFRARAVHKRYAALVLGVFATPEQRVELYVGPHPGRPGKVATSARPRAGFADAATRVRIVASWPMHTLVHLWPETGRTHQLRAHLAAIGHPIVADIDYGGPPLLLSQLKRGYKLRTGRAEQPLLRRMFLHCEHVEFTDLDGTPVAVDAPLPDDLSSALTSVDRTSVRVGDQVAGRGERAPGHQDSGHRDSGHQDAGHHDSGHHDSEHQEAEHQDEVR